MRGNRIFGANYISSYGRVIYYAGEDSIHSLCGHRSVDRNIKPRWKALLSELERTTLAYRRALGLKSGPHWISNLTIARGLLSDSLEPHCHFTVIPSSSSGEA